MQNRIFYKLAKFPWCGVNIQKNIPGEMPILPHHSKSPFSSNDPYFHLGYQLQYLIEFRTFWTYQHQLLPLECNKGLN